MIYLEPMAEKDFDEYAERSCASFAQESPRFHGVDPAVALEEVRKEFFTKIMPAGFKSQGHFLFNIVGANVRVGQMHLAEHPPGSKTIFAWDFEISESYRRQGFAKQAMLEAGKFLSAKGYEQVSLNVFGNNTVAIKLYEAMDFKITQVQMSRSIK